MTNARKWNLQNYEDKRNPIEDCIENAFLCETIANSELMVEPVEAIFWQKKALDIREKLYGKNSIENVLQYERLAEYHLENNAPKSGLLIAKKILKIREKALGNEHIELANSYLSLSKIYSSYEISDYNNALLYANLSAEIEALNRCPENPVSYRTHLQLAKVYGFRYFQDYQPNMAEPSKPEADTENEKQHYLLAMKSAVQEYGDTSVEAATCYQRYVHIIESCPEKRLALSAKALQIFYPSEGANGSNTRQIAADIWYSWTDVHWFPWDKGNNKSMVHFDRRTIGYGIKWISENVSKEIATNLTATFDSKDREMIYDILQSSDPIPPVVQ